MADELPDDFIRDIKAAALAEKPDALLLGERWDGNEQITKLLCRHSLKCSTCSYFI